MGDVRVVVDILSEDLDAVTEAARQAHRDRKHQLEWIITDWVRKNVKREKQQ